MITVYITVTTTLHVHRQGESRVLVCSDMAARGLDLPNTSLVVQVVFSAVCWLLNSTGIL